MVWDKTILILQSASYTGVSITALWPATAIESHVTSVFGVKSKFMRKPEIFADACLAIAEESSERSCGMPYCKNWQNVFSKIEQDLKKMTENPAAKFTEKIVLIQ